MDGQKNFLCNRDVWKQMHSIYEKQAFPFNYRKIENCCRSNHSHQPFYCALRTFLPIMNCVGDYYVLGSNHLYALLQKGFFPIIPHQHQAHVSARSKKLYLWRAEKWFWRGSLFPALLDIDVWLTILPSSYNHLFMKFKFSSRKLLYPFRRLAF